ncbi:enoyl-CoA hydratase-related protein [Pseudorhodoferax soli]|uniref:2-(1,2-epoxy-1,2-dihydrophenyl)acetyl-CoA isomerase n=1 Tax=Pseudorhodoferax soli TaxID=545864 RepID=A0A368Y837_9BURK|nr:enoyl-CoA hydratase-related protein [Pseudorhodoferax soli]RCW76423.1 2-(1,2-epoxy-1,2-dihydrophenyl)acetyl-CoA isomerase [Pseudorhodoferax soli]
MTIENPLLEERHGDVLVISLNIPERLNPIARELQHALRARLAALREDRSVAALVLTGSGRAFCVGADLSSNMAGNGTSVGQASYETMESLSNRIIEDLRTLPMPVVSAVNGPAAGAGVGIALAADVVMAARSAYFYLPFMPKLGIVPDLGTTWFLERFVGRARAVGMTMLNEKLSAEQAAQWGLIWSVVDDADLRTQALALAERLAKLPAHAAREVRAAYDSAGRVSLVEQMRYEAERQRELLDAPSFAEGVKAFREKRDPIFPRN